MSYKPRSLFRLIGEINYSLFLPHIQRPFVWEEEQMRRLFDSLMRNYPIQTLLFWRTKDAIKVRGFMPTINWDADLHLLYDNAKSASGVEKTFVLDGQQRLQTLFALFNGSVLGSDGKTELEAYTDLTAGDLPNDDGFIHDVKFSATQIPLPFYRLRDLLGKDSQQNAETIADAVNDELDLKPGENDQERRARQKRVRRNCGQLLSLLREEKHFWVQELDGVADAFPYRVIRDIFVRVNSGGTKLDSGDLMFAAMKEGWADIEENVEQIVELLNNGKLSFDKDNVLKALVVAHGAKAELDPEKFTSAAGEALLDALRRDWPRAEGAFQQLRDFIENDLKLYSDKVVRSYGSFVPLFDYLFHNPKPDEANRALMRAYYYKSQLFNWYSSRTDALLNVMHGIVGKAHPSGFPMEDVKSYFRLSRGQETEIKIEHLDDIRLRFIILNLIYVVRFSGSPFNVQFKGNEPHVDHIYPQSALRRTLGLATGEINTLGNYRLLGATDNLRKRAELPAEYFRRLKNASVDIEKHLILKEFSDDPARLTFDIPTYTIFRNRRIQAIFEICERVVNPELQPQTTTRIPIQG